MQHIQNLEAKVLALEKGEKEKSELISQLVIRMNNIEITTTRKTPTTKTSAIATSVTARMNNLENTTTRKTPTKTGQLCVNCNGRFAHHGGDIQGQSAWYICIWCGVRLKNTIWTRIKHERKCVKKQTESPCVCWDPCSSCYKRDLPHGPAKVYVRCRHSYCQTCDPKEGVIPQSCGKCTADWWDEEKPSLDLWAR